MNAEKLFDRKGTGYLILKTGTEAQVEWEVDILTDGTIDNGVVRGDEILLAKAAEDKGAVLRLAAGKTAAIVIDSCAGGKAYFTTLLASLSTFDAQTIRGCGPMPESKFVLVFSSETGEDLSVIVPSVVMRDYLPILRKELPDPTKHEPRTSFIRVPETWSTATTRNHPYVCVIFDKDQPIALTPENARELAGELLAGANKHSLRNNYSHANKKHD